MKAYYNSNEILVSISKEELIRLSDHCFDAYLKWQRKEENAKTEYEKQAAERLADKALDDSVKLIHIVNSLPF